VQAVARFMKKRRLQSFPHVVAQGKHGFVIYSPIMDFVDQDRSIRAHAIWRAWIDLTAKRPTPRQ
jgi:hypothetical protein